MNKKEKEKLAKDFIDYLINLYLGNIPYYKILKKDLKKTFEKK